MRQIETAVSRRDATFATAAGCRACGQATLVDPPGPTIPIGTVLRRRLYDRLLDTEAVALLARADALRELGLLLALEGLPKRDDGDHATASYQLYALDVRRAGRPATVVIGWTDPPIAVIRAVMRGLDAADLRPFLSDLFRQPWSEYAAQYQTREDAGQALADLVWRLDFPKANPVLTRGGLHVVIAILAIEDI